MKNNSRCREKAEGWLGRKRNYKCIECQTSFQVDTLYSIPKGNRVCDQCRGLPTYVFIDKVTGREVEIRASDAELATLRAWKVSKTLTYKM